MAFLQAFLHDRGVSPLEDRARARIRADIAAKRYSQTQLAKEAGRSDPWVSEVLNPESGSGLPYEIIEAAGRLRLVDPAEFVKADGSDLRALNGAEQDLVDWSRTWPTETRDAFLRFVGAFASGPARELEIRRVAEAMRDMTRSQRIRIVGYADMVKHKLDERPLSTPPDPLSIDAIVKDVPAGDPGRLELKKLARKVALAHRQAKRRTPGGAPPRSPGSGAGPTG